MHKKLFTFVLFLFLTTFLIILFNAFFSNSNYSNCLSKHHFKSVSLLFKTSEEEFINRFQTGLRYKTVCWEQGNYNAEELSKFIDFTIKAYPAVHSSKFVQFERVSNYSLLYTIKGNNESITPYLLMSHIDVVPADNIQKWEHPPFGAEQHDNYIYARGSIDDKHNFFAIMEVLEHLFSNDFIPERSFFFAVGHDEECNGLEGAGRISLKLAKLIDKLDFILDEGTVISKDILPSISNPVALIGISEKGYLTIKISASTSSGHSSIPPKESSIGIISKAILNLESNPHKSMLRYGSERNLLELLSDIMGFKEKFFLRNIWIFSPILSWFLSLNPITNSLIRTTTSVTMFKAGIKENVVAPYAEAIINHRIHPLQSVSEVFDYDIKVINDPRVKVDIVNSYEPHPYSPYSCDCSPYFLIKDTIENIWKDENAIVLPAVMPAKTDTGHYLNFTKNIYRFSPIELSQKDMKSIHNLNERISIKSYKKMILFYNNFIQNADIHYDHDFEHDKDEL